MSDNVTIAQGEMGDHADCVAGACPVGGLHLTPPEQLQDPLPPTPVAPPAYYDRMTRKWVTPVLSPEEQVLAEEIATKQAERDAFNARALAAFRALSAAPLL